jgi:XTP/dITP diphosphohydrolase
MNRHTLVLATKNQGKLVEFRALFGSLGVTLITATEALGRDHEIEEDGAAFEANATKKAAEIASLTSLMTMADDSGLEVDALGGAPGVRSARYAHTRATDAENNAALLRALEALGHTGGLPDPKARFRCVLALIDPFTEGGAVRLARGSCEGSIVRTGRGSGGFGYDPLFLLEGDTRTMAELGDEEKNRVSHRAKAATQMKSILEEVLRLRERAAGI